MSSIFFNGLALLLCTLAAGIFYLGCPNQQWLTKRPLGFYPMTGISALVLIPAWLLFHQHMSTLSSSFAVLTALMLLLGLLPFAAYLDKPLSQGARATAGIVKGPSASSYQPHWWLRLGATLVLGYPLAVGLSGVFAHWGPGPLTHDVKSQLVMWLITPLWLLPVCLVFFIHHIKWILGLLIGLNGIVYLLLWLAGKGV